MGLLWTRGEQPGLWLQETIRHHNQKGAVTPCQSGIMEESLTVLEFDLPWHGGRRRIWQLSRLPSQELRGL